jgi:hypothetical protein
LSAGDGWRAAGVRAALERLADCGFNFRQVRSLGRFVS